MDYTIQDSGSRRDFGTGAVRDCAENKGRYDLIPPAAIERIAKHFEKGANKYAERNWENGIPNHCFLDSAMRHIFKYSAGATDEDHLVAACWNLMCLLDNEVNRPEMSDIPSRMAKKNPELSLIGFADV